MRKGYVISRAEGSSFYVDNVEHIERDDNCYPFMYQDDEEAVRAAEADGIKLIRDMPGVPDGVYVDTSENRHLLLEYFVKAKTPAAVSNYLSDTLTFYIVAIPAFGKSTCQEFHDFACALSKFSQLRDSGKYIGLELLREGIPNDPCLNYHYLHTLNTWEAPESETKTSAFSTESKALSHQIQTWKYTALRYFMNHCRAYHEVIPMEGSILYILVRSDVESLRPVIEPFQKKYSLYVQTDSCEDSTLLAIMEKWEHAPAELAIKHKIFRANLYE